MAENHNGGAAQAVEESPAGVDRRRWVVLGLLFAASGISYINRQTLSVLAPVLRAEFGMSNTDYSNLVNSFLFAFTIMYVVGGRAMDRLGGYLGLLIAVLFWSAATALHALAGSVLALAVCRFLLGVGEAPQPPACAKMVAGWFRPGERGFATSVYLLGATVGATVAPPLVVALHHYGRWRFAFAATALLGVVWALFWYPLGRPPASTQSSGPAQMVPIRPLLRSRATWGILGLRFFLDPVWFFYVFWLPEYLVRSKGLSMQMVAIFAWLPFLAADAGTLAGGSVASWLQHKGWSIDRSHRTVMVGSALLMMCSATVPLLDSPWQCLGAMSIAIIGMQMFGANNHTLPAHIFPAAAVGTVAGLGGAAAGVGSMLFMRFIGVSVDWTHSYVLAFTVAGLVNPVMCLASLWLTGRIRRLDVAWLRLAPMGLLLLLPAAPMAAAAPDLRLAGDAFEVRLDPQAKGALQALTDRASGRNFIARTKAPTLFRLTVAGADGKVRDLTAADASEWAPTVVAGAKGQELVLRYRGLGREDLDVECRVRLDREDGMSYWKIAVANRSSQSLRSVVYPVLSAVDRLGEEWRDDRLLAPGQWSAGHVRHSQGPPQPFPGGGKSLHPGPAPVQFLAYYDSTAGLYIATRDSVGHPKRLGFTNGAEGLDLSVQHEIWKSAGQTWALPYEVVLGAFHGDWYAAADIYKKWATGQPWCARKLTERSDIPAWFREGRPFVRFLPRAGEYTGAGRPPRAPDLFRSRPPLPAPGLMPRAPALFADIGRALGAPFVVVEYGWEKQAMWINPDVFPPYGGDELFRRQNDALRRAGNVLCAYISGTHWAVAKVGRTDWDGQPDFERRGLAAAATGPDQKPIVDQRPWAANVRLCIGSPLTRETMLGLVSGLAGRGVGFVQYDQNVGGQAYECHNSAHPHPPGYGEWMAQATHEFLRAARRAGRTADRDFVLTIEQPGEHFIQDLDGFNDRPYASTKFGESVPVFQYLYHEYILSFGGDNNVGLHCPESELIRLARSLHAGMLVEGPTFGPSNDWPLAELEYLAAIARAQRGFAHDFVMLGRMLPAPRLENVPVIEAALLGGTRDVPLVVGTERTPVATASAWKSPSGRTGYVLTNVAREPVSPILRLNGATRWVKQTAAGSAALTVVDGKCKLTLGPREIALVTEASPDGAGKRRSSR
jgi:ACS family hexuronate transporter-like MFS transporter